jgi:8-oxo-dGTP diphosphatase
MKRIFSAGGIVFNNVGQVLLTKAGSLRDESKKHWAFPKGHIDPGETSTEAALREVKEETGVEAKIISKVGDSKYTFAYNGEKIFKVASYFLMEYISGELIPQIGEIEEVDWVSTEEALKILSFSADKDLLKKALELRG